MRADIVAGAVFPDYELTITRANVASFPSYRGQIPMVLVLSRGGFCPKDRRQAEGLVQLHHEMEVGYSRLVTISTDNMLLTNEYRDGVGAHWTFLSDPGRKVQKDLDIAEYTDPEHDPMIPHVIVLEPGLVIFKIYNGYWFFADRASRTSARLACCVDLEYNETRFEDDDMRDHRIVLGVRVLRDVEILLNLSSRIG